MTSQRELLRARRLPRERVTLAADTTAYGAALREVAEALADADTPPTKDQQARIEKAQKASAAQLVVTLEVKCLPPAEWEALLAMHPALPSEPNMSWNTATFRPAVCAACVVPPDDETPYTVAEWNELVRVHGALSSGEEDLLFMTAVQLNQRAVQVQPQMGKG